MTKQSLHPPKYFPAKPILVGTVGGTIMEQQGVFDPTDHMLLSSLGGRVIGNKCGLEIHPLRKFSS